MELVGWLVGLLLSHSEELLFRSLLPLAITGSCNIIFENTKNKISV
jgi:hypothetical protein